MQALTVQLHRQQSLAGPDQMLKTLTLLLLMLLAANSPAQDLLPANTSIQDAIDKYVADRVSAAKAITAEQLEDNILLRRTMLDLVGRIPTAAEVEAYVADSDPAKREKLVDRLMQQDEFIEHLAYDLNNLLSPAGKNDLEAYVVDALKNKKGWDQMFSQMLNGDYKDPMAKQAMQFVNLRIKDQDNLANDTSSLFFGVNISCAKCHDHPLVLEWTQDHFYGMKSFFNRTFSNGDYVAERGYGEVKYKTTEGEEKSAKLMFLTGSVIDEPKPVVLDDKGKRDEKRKLDEFKKQKKPVPPPNFSRRAKLVEIALKDNERDYFAKNIVNRMWFRIFGRGLVMPLDQMHPENPASHPALLNWLARDTYSHGYDITRLIRGMVLSKTYSQSSRYESENRPEPELFAVANLKPLSPRQYAAALAIAARNPSHWTDPKTAKDRIRSEVNAHRGWANRFVVPGDGFQVGADEALLLSNDSSFEDKIQVSNSRLAGELVKIESVDEMVELAYKTVHSRSATPDELNAISQFLEARKDRRDQAVSQVVWALLTSSELRFNH